MVSKASMVVLMDKILLSQGAPMLVIYNKTLNRQGWMILTKVSVTMPLWSKSCATRIIK